MTRLTKLFFLFSLLCFFSLPSFPARADKDGLTIEKALDGETVQLSDGRIIRLIGVRTANIKPLLIERYKLSPDQLEKLPLGRLTTDSVDYTTTHTVGKNIILSFDPSNAAAKHLDAQGRLLAYIWYTTYAVAHEGDEDAAKLIGIQSQNRMLNQELVMMGYALADTASPFVQQSLFLDYEKDAAKSNRGFWRSTAEFYRSLLEKAKGQQFGSTAGFIGEEARDLSFKTAWDNYEKLIQLNPQDPQPYYQRSWLGASSTHDKITETNLTDIDQAISLSSFDPKTYMQRHYLLRLLGKHDEALEAFETAMSLAAKLGMPLSLSPMAEAEIEQPLWRDVAHDPAKRRFAMEAIRATLNEDLFLYFMAHYQSYGDPVPEEAEKIYNRVKNLRRFEPFRLKNAALLSAGNPRLMIYQTQWALKGLTAPEDTIRWMESIGEAPAAEPKEAKKN